jgi:hypothetical protein
MDAPFDPRVWNIVAGVGLLAGCSARTIGQDGGEGTDTGEDAETEGPECIDNSDCPPGYDCEAGVCYYWGYDDGWVPYYECYSDSECADYSLCISYYCEGLWPRPVDCPAGAWSAQFTIPEAQGALRTQFVDVDEDGRDELVVATQSEFLIFPPDLPSPPTVVAREPASDTITDMVAGDFDGEPGEDLLLLVGDQLHLHLSNGVDGFAAAVPQPAPSPAPRGLVAGAFNPEPRTDVLIWGQTGAQVDDRQGNVLEVAADDIVAAAALELGSVTSGFGLRTMGGLRLPGLDGSAEFYPNLPGEPYTVAALSSNLAARFVTWTSYADGAWSLAHFWHPLSADFEQVALPGAPGLAVSADLDGNGASDLIYFGPGLGYSLHVDPYGEGIEVGGCWVGESLLEAPAVAAAVGDITTLGNLETPGEEVAVQLEDGRVTVLSGL